MDDNTELAGLTADIVAAYVSNNPLPSNSLPEVIKQVHSALANVSTEGASAAEQINLVPAVSVRKYVTDDQITGLECGKQFKSLKRHIRTYHNVTPDEYRARWKLPADYPMVAPNYSESRAKMAKQFGLGRKRGK
jgi:predicted transcriptional regulator